MKAGRPLNLSFQEWAPGSWTVKAAWRLPGGLPYSCVPAAF